MINAFGLCRTIATAHEDLIGAEMLKHERLANFPKSRSRNSVINHNTQSRIGTSPARKDKIDALWLDRAKKIRKFLEANVGATTTEVVDGIGEDRSTTCAWLMKMRSNPKYGIRHAKGLRFAKKYTYWRAEDTPQFKG